MPIPSAFKHMAPAEQAMIIHAAECEVAEAVAWSHTAMRASDRIKMRAKITLQEQQIWQAKHGQ